jgi:hypothetical protein
VSNVKVRVTVGGGDVAMNRTSDAQGRFDVVVAALWRARPF